MLEYNGIRQPPAATAIEEMTNSLRQFTIRWEASIHDYVAVVESLGASIHDQESVLRDQESVAQASDEQRESILRMRKNREEQQKALQGQLADLRSRTRELRNRAIAAASKLAQLLAASQPVHPPAGVAHTEPVIIPPALQSQDTVIPEIRQPEASLH